MQCLFQHHATVINYSVMLSVVKQIKFSQMLQAMVRFLHDLIYPLPFADVMSGRRDQ